MKTFLFSIDLEEFYAERAEFHRTPLPELVERYLGFLRRRQMKATFFVVGEIAKKFPAVIRAIAAEGHELACHTFDHVPLDQQDAASLRDDLRRNLDALAEFATTPVQGFRAPILSLGEKQRWAYEVLAGLGFTYSSSVLPARNPLHGWPGFGLRPRRIDGVLEVPVTLSSFFGLEVPIGAGTYFRCLPFGSIQRRFADHAAADTAIVGYFHPYDLDTAQERVMSRGVGGRRLLNALLYFNRSGTLARLESILDAGFRIVPYRDFIPMLVHA
ncbi:MAG: polysaccharide deacetylase family protein [Chthoniobacter sp.]|uniref:polysaccharide deacetylase family protein n=1 Tax=Chthoniobacter sp. TaxID=2510640 RepID=UPI0032AB85AA